MMGFCKYCNETSDCIKTGDLFYKLCININFARKNLHRFVRVRYIGLPSNTNVPTQTSLLICLSTRMTYLICVKDNIESTNLK